MHKQASYIEQRLTVFFHQLCFWFVNLLASFSPVLLFTSLPSPGCDRFLRLHQLPVLISHTQWARVSSDQISSSHQGDVNLVSFSFLFFVFALLGFLGKLTPLNSDADLFFSLKCVLAYD